MVVVPHEVVLAAAARERAGGDVPGAGEAARVEVVGPRVDRDRDGARGGGRVGRDLAAADLLGGSEETVDLVQLAVPQVGERVVDAGRRRGSDRDGELLLGLRAHHDVLAAVDDDLLDDGHFRGTGGAGLGGGRGLGGEDIGAGRQAQARVRLLVGLDGRNGESGKGQGAGNGGHGGTNTHVSPSGEGAPGRARVAGPTGPVCSCEPLGSQEQTGESGERLCGL
ncbi:hypothetical protein GCM10010253_48850 [Streptomyces badius]|uniref:Uncharacterized protein n=1 Tax=Streptomyces badius TaxID=1941 RepID=A0ABQ2TFQ6_STRBA|nr:hypothetical protein GCM10010253_48850 [Streptomyces badius]